MLSCLSSLTILSSSISRRGSQRPNGEGLCLFASLPRDSDRRPPRVSANDPIRSRGIARRELELFVATRSRRRSGGDDWILATGRALPQDRPTSSRRGGMPASSKRQTVHIPAPWQLSPVGVRREIDWDGCRTCRSTLRLSQEYAIRLFHICACVYVCMCVSRIFPVRQYPYEDSNTTCSVRRVYACICICIDVCTCLSICLQSGRSQILHIYMIQLA